MVKLVDTKDLKLPFGSASSSLAEGTIRMNNIQIISDKNLRSLKIKKSLLKILKSEFKKPKTIIVIGGDGFMLQTLKKIRNLNFFYGVNSGNYGFLMNKFSPNNFVKNFSKSKTVSISPLEMTVKK